MCDGNASIYFSDLVPSQSSCVVTEKPLACSQRTSKYADYPLHSCMPWFIDPSEQFENTQLKKKIKNQHFFPIITSPSFLMGMQFGKGTGLFLKLYLLRVFSQEIKNDSCSPLVNYLMRRTSAGKSQKEHSLREVSRQWEPLFPAFPKWFLSRTHPSAEVFFSVILLFSSQELEGAVLLPSTQRSPTALPSLLSCLSRVRSLSFHLLCILIYLENTCQCTEDVYQHCGGWDPFGVPCGAPGITEHNLHRDVCNDGQKWFKRISWWVFRSLCLDNRQNDQSTFIYIFLCSIRS